MSWKLFGKSITNEIVSYSSKYGKGYLELEQTFNTYFLGIRISSNSTDLRCIKAVLNGKNGYPEPIQFNSINCEMKLLPGQKVYIEKELKSNWYKWSCISGNGSGIAQTEKEASRQGKKYCGFNNYNISPVLVTQLNVHYDEVFS